MTEKLTLAVNHALNDVRLARARAMLINPGMGLDAKREIAWCEYGFKDDLTFDDLHKLYRRGGIAYGAVNKLVSNCWKTNPQVIEGICKISAASPRQFSQPKAGLSIGFSSSPPTAIN